MACELRGSVFGSEILEVAIGLVFVYLVTSLVATAIREAIEGVLKTRAIQLERGIRQLLDDPSGLSITKQVFDHPMIFSLFAGEYQPQKLTTFFMSLRRGGSTTNPDGSTSAPRRAGLFTNLPAYIPSGNFALALLHTVAGQGTDGAAGVLTLSSVSDGTMLLPDGRLKQAMLVALGEARGDIDRARASLETWYDGTMDRVSGWYKRETSYILFGLGLAIAIALNVNTTDIARTLAANNAIRQQLVAHVDATYPATKSGTPPDADQAAREVAGLSSLLGWDNYRGAEREALRAKALRDPVLKTEAERQAWVDDQMAGRLPWLRAAALAMAGWLVSALAISLGAPFWFDLLNKLMVIRSTVKPYEKSSPEASADRGAIAREDRLAPDAARGGAAAGVGAVGGAAQPPGPGPAQPSAGPLTATLRLALDGADPGTVRLIRDGIEEAVAASHLVEVVLQIGTPHRLEATGSKAGRPVAWSNTFNPTADDDQRPVAAELV